MPPSAGDSLRILHLASLARSGETLVLRALAAHPEVQVVHDLRAENSAADQALYRWLRVWPLATAPRRHVAALLGPGGLAPERRVLVLKQGVFAPRHRPAGFALLRNPYAVFCSLWSYDARRLGQEPGPALNARHWARFRLPRLLVWADASLPGLLPALRSETDPVRQFLLYWRSRLDQILAQQSVHLHYEDLVADPAAGLRRLCDAAGLPFDAAMLTAERGYERGALGHGGIRLDAPIQAAPAWQPDPLVPLAPFAEAVDAGPVAAWHGLYRRPPAPLRRPVPTPLPAEPRAFDEALAAGRTADARAAWQAQPPPPGLEPRLGHMRRGLRLLQAEMEAVRHTGQALMAADPLALALEVSLLRKLDPAGYASLRGQLLALGLCDAVDARSAPLALALEQLDPQDAGHRRLAQGLLQTLPALALGKLFRHPALPRNGALLQRLLDEVLADPAPAGWTPEGWLHLLMLAYAIAPRARFDALLQRLRAQAPGPAAAIARRFVLPGERAGAPVPGPRLRIALCLSGQMRGWREALPTWRHLGLQGHDVDVYVHTWRDLGRRLPDPEIMPSVRRVFADADFAEAYIRAGQRHGLAALQRAYPRLFAGLASQSQVSAEELRQAFGPGATVVVEDDADPRFAGWDNPMRMHYKIHAAQRLVQASGRRYDLVIRLRPDKLLRGAERLPDWPLLAAQSAREQALFCEEPLGLREGLVMGDQFAAGASGPMAAYAEAWSLQPQAAAEGWPGFPDRFTGHTTLAWTCLWQGLRPQALPGLQFGPMAEASQITGAQVRALLALDRPQGPRDAMDALLWQGLQPQPGQELTA